MIFCKNTRTSDTSRTSPFYGLSETCTAPVQVRTSGFYKIRVNNTIAVHSKIYFLQSPLFRGLC